MTQNQKEKLVKKVADIDNYYHQMEILRLVSKHTGNSTMENMVELEFC